jgi:hypothetical protein
MSADHEAFSKESLGRRFRERYLAGLLKLFRKGELVLPESMAWIQTEQDLQRWLAPIATIQWHAHCQGPPHGCDGPEAALSYLARYVGGSAISDSRILSDDGRTVVIRVKNYRKGGIYETLPLPGEEFVRLFLLHVLPRRMHRVRYGGLFSPQKRKELLELARRMLIEQNPLQLTVSMSGQEEEKGDPSEGEEEQPKQGPVCPRCLMPNMKRVGHCTARELAGYLVHLHYFWARITTVILLLPFDHRRGRHAADSLGAPVEWLAWSMTTLDVDMAVAYCDAPPPDT